MAATTDSITKPSQPAMECNSLPDLVVVLAG